MWEKQYTKYNMVDVFYLHFAMPFGIWNAKAPLLCISGLDV